MTEQKLVTSQKGNVHYWGLDRPVSHLNTLCPASPLAWGMGRRRYLLPSRDFRENVPLNPKFSGGLNQPGLFGQGVEDGVGIGEESGGGVKLLQLSIFQYQHPETYKGPGVRTFRQQS